MKKYATPGTLLGSYNNYNINLYNEKLLNSLKFIRFLQQLQYKII